MDHAVWRTSWLSMPHAFPTITPQDTSLERGGPALESLQHLQRIEKNEGKEALRLLSLPSVTTHPKSLFFNYSLGQIFAYLINT
jgi:hypothetical protein